MKILITGTPGTGKTTVSEKLSKDLNLPVVNEKSFSETHGLGDEIKEQDLLEVDLEDLENALLKDLKTEWILEGHMVCQVQVKPDFVFVLRSSPGKLEPLLKKRGYPEQKVNENLMAEFIDYCKVQAIENNPKAKVIEVNTTKRSVSETVDFIKK
ncbi:MAG: AAA family ATPase, partial [Candidatus Diapherotrites archaeon]|nr:AAA family ATPase [Candidatus Diapherotrites archaeon]